MIKFEGECFWRLRGIRDIQFVDFEGFYGGSGEGRYRRRVFMFVKPPRLKIKGGVCVKEDGKVYE